jgi:type I restriction-modification system DNA methylase subunit
MSLNAHSGQLNILVSLFSTNIVQYKSGHYDESNTRTDFIDKFFTLFDWDIANNQGFSESYREVVREDKVKIDDSKKAPDYSFRIGGVRKFFVEAKKPSVNIKDSTEPAYQIRRYAYTAKLPLSILTNFAEFAVYDTRIKPNKDDKASTARIFYCTYDQYEQHLDFIGSIFSKNAILKGSFDKYIEENKNKKGTSEVDTELLALVEKWRVELAKNIARNNPDLSIYDLNTVVQRIIDRIMFLRIAEDKGIEDENLLLSVTKNQSIYEKLIHLFAKANVKYNSGLFAGVDWIDKVNIENKVLSNIIVNLYYPECPYEFSVLPVEILGSIYERFLGKTIRFRNVKGDTHTAIIEEKPEVKKAGGVYYTPQYIVDYIVQNTVGEKIKNKTPQEISTIRIIDPACGSGSFLVGAYQYLLDYHLDYYTQAKNIKTAIKGEKIYETAFRSYRLTIEEKQRILTSAIYGVDIDNQAVEVTKLSLYLKLLENEGKEAEGWLFKYSDKTLLPSLEDNIKCGNSLIGTDFYAQPNLELTDDDLIKVNCFDWDGKDGFMEIFKNGGFDVVIGNPPYVFTRGDGFTNAEKEYYYAKFKQQNYQLNTFAMFTEQGHNILKVDGFFGFIIPNNWLTISSMKKFRDFIISCTGNVIIVNNFYKVFIGANVDTSLLVFTKIKPGVITLIESVEPGHYENISSVSFTDLLDDQIIQFKSLKNAMSNLIIKKIETQAIVLGNISTVKSGLKAYETGKGTPIQTDKMKRDRIYHSITKKDNNYRPYLEGKDVKRYKLDWSGQFLKYGKNLAAPRKRELFEGERILVRQIPSLPPYSINGTITIGDEVNDINSMIIIHPVNNYSLKFILGVINSRLITYWFDITFDKFQRAIFPQFKVNELEQFPIPSLDLSKKSDKVKHDNLVSLVNKILELKQKEATEKNQQLKTMIAKQIEGVNKAIDSAVYELYNLIEDEIKVVEGVKQ